VTYTNAPRGLDWLFTKELSPRVGHTQDGHPVRVVETGSLWPAQRRRYQLEGYWAGGERDWARLLAGGGANAEPWDNDEHYLAFLRARGLTNLSRRLKELLYEGYQAGRLSTL
jgi:hypothetical protein